MMASARWSRHISPFNSPFTTHPCHFFYKLFLHLPANQRKATHSMHKPIKTFFLLLSVVVALGIIALIFPKQGIRLSNSITLTFPSLGNIIMPDTSGTKSINQLFNPELLAKIEVQTDSLPTIDSAIGALPKVASDTSEVLPDSLAPTFTIKNIESKLPDISIEHSDSAKAALRNFFESLQTIQTNSTPIRVLHYGDSQIEMDRISSRLRKRLQEQFSGGGCGFITLESVEQSYLMSVTSTNLWDTRKIKNKDDKEKKDFGPFFSSARIGITETGVKKEGYITINQNRLGRMVSRFSFCYRPTSPASPSDKMRRSNTLRRHCRPFDQAVGNNRNHSPFSKKTSGIKMQANQSPLIFGLGVRQ